jgi:hypothetical protein
MFATNSQLPQAGTTLSYRPDLEAVVARQRDWFAGARPYLITLIPDFWNGFNWDLSIDVQTRRPIEEYDFTNDEQLYDFLDFRLQKFQTYWDAKLGWGLDDDYIPVFEPRLGWGEVVAPFVRDARVVFYAQTSALEPVIDDYLTLDWSCIGFHPENPGTQILTKMNTWSQERARGRFLVQPRALDTNPSDIAKALRGGDFFTDFISNPDDVHRLMKLATQCAIDLIEYQRLVIGGPTLGGYGTTWHGGYWTPGTVIGHEGDNVSDLISGSMFEKFILPYLQQFVEHFGGTVFARDVTTRQLWSRLRKLGNVLAFKPRNMGSTQVQVKDILAIAQQTERLPLFLQVFSLDELKDFLAATQKAQIRAFFVFQCPDREQGQRALDLVREAKN